MSAMSSPSQPEPLDTMLERLIESEAKMAQLRQSFAQLHQSFSVLEAEQSEILQQCKNEIRAHAATDKARMDVNQRKDRDVIMHDPHTQDRQHDYMPRIPPGSISLQGLEGAPDLAETITKLKRELMERTEDDRDTKKRRTEQEHNHNHIIWTGPSQFGGHKTRDQLSHNPDVHFSSLSGGLGVVAGLSPPGLMPVAQSNQHPTRYPPRPPVGPYPFPEGIDLLSYPSDLKHEESDWFALFNPSLKVKRMLDVKLVHTLMQDSVVYCVKFSRDGKWLATIGYQDNTAQIYDVKTGIKICVLDHRGGEAGNHNIRTYDLCFSPEGNHLATTTSINNVEQIRLWNISKKQIDNILEGHQTMACDLNFSSNGRFIVFESDDTVYIWDFHNGTSKVLTIDDHYSPHRRFILSVALSPDDRYIATGHGNGDVSILEVITGAVVQRLRGHKDGVSGVKFTLDGKGLISASWDQTLKHWDVSSLGASINLTSPLSTSSPCLMHFTGPTNHANFDVSQDGTWVIARSSNGTVLFWDMRTGVLQCILSEHYGNVINIDLSPTGNFLATMSDRNCVRIWRYEALG